MSLSADATSIKIQNPQGVTMFDSTQKLVHRKSSITGTRSLGAGYTISTDISLPAALTPGKDFVLVYITPTAANGNVITQSINSTIQLNFTMLCHFTHFTTTDSFQNYDVMGSTVLGIASPFVRISMWGTEPLTGFNSSRPRSAVTFVTFDYRIVVFTYQ